MLELLLMTGTMLCDEVRFLAFTSIDNVSIHRFEL
jgi:hypothetical protein